MISSRVSPSRFKKKIAELLRQVLAESSEFAAAFKVERSMPSAPVVRKEDAQVQELQTEVYNIDSERFKEALKSVPEDLLELIARQFSAQPVTLIVEESRAATSQTNADSLSDDIVPEDFADEESE